MADVFDFELHEEENPRDSDDDIIEIDDVSIPFNSFAFLDSLTWL